MLLLYLSVLETEDDRARISKIYETYLDWMLQMAFHYLQDEGDAEDAVNDVFLSIIDGNASIPMDNENETKSYLFICVRNSALNIKKSKSKIQTVNIEEQYEMSSDVNIENELVGKYDAERLLGFINTMPVIYKDILTLVISFDKSLKEISKILKLPFKTVETRFRRGRAILKERYKELDI